MTHSFYRSYGFLAAMLACIVLGCAVGAAWSGAVCLEPLGTVFINMMFCLVVPLVFCSLAGSIANTRSRRRAGRILGATLGVFVVTGLLAAFIMLVIVRVFPPVLTPWTDAAAGTVDDPAPLATLLVNFFTVNDFSALLSRRAMLPLIVFSLLFGFSVSACGGPDTGPARVLDDATKCLLKMVSLVSCYAPIAFFGFFAARGELVADGVLEVIADVALAHGAALGEGHIGLDGLGLGGGGHAEVDHADLGTVAVSDDDLVALRDQVDDGLGGLGDESELLIGSVAQRVAAERNDDAFTHGDISP